MLNAAFDASNHNYLVVVVRDLVRGTNEEMEDAALKMVSLHPAWSWIPPICSPRGKRARWYSLAEAIEREGSRPC